MLVVFSDFFSDFLSFTNQLFVSGEQTNAIPEISPEPMVLLVPLETIACEENVFRKVRE